MIPDPDVWHQPRAGGAWYKIGQPAKNPHYIRTCGHCGQEFLGKKSQLFCSATCSARGALRQRRYGSDHPNWTDLPSYRAVHARTRRERGEASEHACADCGIAAHEWSYDGSDPDELKGDAGGDRECKYSLRIEHYIPRCRSCHRRHDGVPRGELHYRAKLTDAQARGIRASVLQPDPSIAAVTQQELADLFGVSRTTIGEIRRNESRTESGVSAQSPLPMSR